MHRFARVAVPCVLVSVFGVSALAQERPPRGDQPAGERPQPGPGGPGGGQRGPGGPGGAAALSPEKAKAAWALEAQGVAKRLALSEEQSKALAKAYAEARESQGKAAQKLRDETREKMREEGADRRALLAEQQEQMQALEKAERTKLETALAATLSAEQVTNALKSLGRFSPQWDNMANAIAGFNLEPAKLQTALETIETFIVNQPAMGRLGPDADREALRESAQAARAKLRDDLAKVLTEEQLTAFEEATRAGRGRGGQGGPGQGPDGERPRRNRENGGG